MLGKKVERKPKPKLGMNTRLIRKRESQTSRSLAVSRMKKEPRRENGFLKR